MITQILLYNQLREDYLLQKNVLYIHHTGKIKFLGENLNLNNRSKAIDYAGGKQLMHELSDKGYSAQFIVAKSFLSGILQYSNNTKCAEYILVKPVENYVYENFLKVQEKLEEHNISLEIVPDRQSFFLTHEEFRKQYSKPPIMEYFYRFMRKKENILMENEKNPLGGKWNYDAENRKFDKNHSKSWNFEREKNDAIYEAEEIYNTNLKSYHITNRGDALKLLEYFIKNHLDKFGALEDAMYQDDPYVHHSMLSSAINYGFLSPREVVDAAIQADTAMNNKEGFVRQILGWREYMYHFFHLYKDTIYSENFLRHTRSLPAYFWKNPENCSVKALRVSLQQVHRENHCHHIQRLMVIGNFALLTNSDPHELNRWFFEFYTDAFEWVVTPNVLSMSQFADGGKLATKPYVSSANYIQKMSDYYLSTNNRDSQKQKVQGEAQLFEKSVRGSTSLKTMGGFDDEIGSFSEFPEHNYKEKYTDDACPFNYLYWCFVADNKEIFEKGRQQFVVKNLEKVDLKRCRELKEKFVKKQK